MDNNDELKKKAKEAMNEILKNVHKDETLKDDKNSDKFKKISEQEQEQEEIRNSLKMQMKLEYESISR